MNKYLALFDIDKTVYNGFTILPLADYQLKHGLLKQKYVDELYDDLQSYKASLVSYEETVANLCIHWANGLKGASYLQVLQNTKDFFKFDGKFYTFFPNVVRLLLKTHDIYLITGEPRFIAQSIADKFRITGYVSAEFEVINDFFTGKVKRFLAKRSEKQEAIQHLLAKHETKNSFGFGDSEGDIEMLGVVHYPICINASPGLQKIALEKNWAIKKPEEVEDFIMTILKN